MLTGKSIIITICHKIKVKNELISLALRFLPELGLTKLASPGSVMLQRVLDIIDF